MKIQIFFVGIIILPTIGCGEKDTTDENEPSTETESFECPSEWVSEGNIWLDPGLCIAWSERSDTLNWDEAKEHCSGLSAGEFTGWRLPTSAELTDLSVRNHPLTLTEGDLWSSTLDQIGLVETVNLEQPGMTILLDKSAEAYTYCVFP